MARATSALLKRGTAPERFGECGSEAARELGRAPRSHFSRAGIDCTQPRSGGRNRGTPEPATSAVSGPQLAVSPLQHSAWFAPNIGHPRRTHAA